MSSQWLQYKFSVCIFTVSRVLRHLTQLRRAQCELHSCCEGALSGSINLTNSSERPLLNMHQAFVQVNTQTEPSMMHNDDDGERKHACVFTFTPAFCRVRTMGRERYSCLLQSYYTLTLSQTFIRNAIQYKHTSVIRRDSWINAPNLLLEIKWWR